MSHSLKKTPLCRCKMKSKSMYKRLERKRIRRTGMDSLENGAFYRRDCSREFEQCNWSAGVSDFGEYLRNELASGRYSSLSQAEAEREIRRQWNRDYVRK